MAEMVLNDLGFVYVLDIVDLDDVDIQALSGYGVLGLECLLLEKEILDEGLEGR